MPFTFALSVTCLMMMLLVSICTSYLCKIFQSSDEENEDIKKDKPRPRVHSSGARKQMSVPEMEREEDDNENRARKVSGCISGNESDASPKENYRKVTRLSSEQIVSTIVGPLRFSQLPFLLMEKYYFACNIIVALCN